MNDRIDQFTEDDVQRVLEAGIFDEEEVEIFLRPEACTAKTYEEALQKFQKTQGGGAKRAALFCCLSLATKTSQVLDIPNACTRGDEEELVLRRAIELAKTEEEIAEIEGVCPLESLIMGEAVRKLALLLRQAT